MIRQLGKVWVLDTNNTTYVMRLLETGQIEHLYYGGRLILQTEEDADSLFEKHAFAPGNTNFYDNEHLGYTLEDMRLEMSSHGKGDIRESFIDVTHADGSYTSDFLYDHCDIREGKLPLETLPSSYEEDGRVDELILTLRDLGYELTLELHYAVFEDRDVITRYSRFINSSQENVYLTKLMSNQLDFERDGMVFTNFTGSWAREMNRNDMEVHAGKIVNSSFTGTSSSRANPFVMISDSKTTEDYGMCIGINLVYSGNHYEAMEVSPFHKTRFVSGINPQSFGFFMEPGEVFESPESVMAYSDDGFNGMSHRMHDFVRECIVRGKWKKKVRPVLLNSWEAAYFDINESKLVKLAKAGKDVGIELFVMDDGWFGNRNDDKTSLGDWDVNRKKLPNGLEGLCKKINALGLDFGIWVEPEMVNVDSDLYRENRTRKDDSKEFLTYAIRKL